MASTMNTSPNVLGVVLARGGSKGLANKHLLPLCGKAVIEYALGHAGTARRLAHTVVSSDCVAIRRKAASLGFATLVRPAHLATDDASVQNVMLHALHAVEAAQGTRFDAAVILYGNVAVRGDGVIDRAVAHWAETGCDSVRTFCPVGKWHPGWMSRINGDRIEPLRPGSVHRRQDLEPLFLHDGAVVVMSRSSLLRGEQTPDDPHAMFGVDRRAILTEPQETVEIDSLRDLFWAEATLRMTQGRAA
jgi:CMP-N-acetylneuraminic acid synthetase